MSAPVHIIRTPDGTVLQSRGQPFDFFDLTRLPAPEGTQVICVSEGLERPYKVCVAGGWIDPEPELGPQQKAAYDAILAGRSCFVTGPGGVGKSEVVRRAVRDLRSKRKTVAVTASTGIAAVNVGGYTIHSLLGTGYSASIKAMVERFSAEQISRAVFRLKDVSTIVVDEVSMLTGDYFDMMDEWLVRVGRMIGRHGAERKPFGGWQIVAVGDFLQLPPVITQRDKVQKKYAFQSQSWKNANLEVFYLRQGYRQDDADHRKHLMRIRKGWAPEDTLDFFNARVGATFPDGINPTKVLSTNAEVDRINARELAKLPLPEMSYAAMFSGNESWIAGLKKSMPCEEVLDLRVGAEVFFIKNNHKLGYVNGDRGRVVAISADAIEVDMYRGMSLEVPRETWEMKNQDDKVLASVMQYPLLLGWAATVHRCQGSSIDYMEFDPCFVFERAQAYVALSRARSMEGMRLTTELTEGVVRASSACVDYYNTVLELERANAAVG